MSFSWISDCVLSILTLDAMNVTVCRATTFSPYQLVFGQDPLARFALVDELRRLDITNEEDIPEGLMNALQPYDTSYNTDKDDSEYLTDEDKLSDTRANSVMDTVSIFNIMLTLNVIINYNLLSGIGAAQ